MESGPSSSSGPKFFIPVRDRLTCLVSLLKRLEELGQPRELTYLIDMDSSYPPLLEKLREWGQSDYVVYYNQQNSGSRGMFGHGILAQFLQPDEWFFLSDPDVVPTPECRPDLLQHMRNCMTLYGRYVKIGLSLKTDDIPAHYPQRGRVQRWEAKYQRKIANQHLINADVATTFCIIRGYQTHDADGNCEESAKARLRSCWGRHLAWYLDPDNLPPDELHYFQNAPIRPWAGKTPGVTWSPLTYHGPKQL
jgi:hypothetical protein